VSITGAWRLEGSWGSGTAFFADGSVGIHCLAAAELDESFLFPVPERRRQR
jgi:hypothetical protein